MEYIKPNKLARYGTIITCGVLLLMAVGAWFILYPEVVTTKARLTGSESPKPIVAQMSARLVNLNVKNGDHVRKGTLIGTLETTADINEVFSLAQNIDEVFAALQKGDATGVKALMNQSFSHLGELQPAYQSLMQAYIAYRDYVAGNYIAQKKQLLSKDLSIAEQSRAVLGEQQSLNKEDLSLSQTTLAQNKKLLDEKLISEQEYRSLTSQNISKRMSEPQMRSGYIGNEQQMNAIHKELVELDNQVATHKATFQQVVYNLKSQIDNWKKNFLLVATETGVVNFTSFLQANQFVEVGKPLAFIIPEHTDIYMQTMIPQANFGKVEKGQRVLLKFDAYPWQEFGTVTATVDYVSAMPADSGLYMAKLSLPKGLITNYNKHILFKEGLLAQAEIITKEMRLTERFYYDLLKQIKK